MSVFKSLSAATAHLLSCKSFENDFAHSFEWVPHATLFCGNDDEVKRARELAPKLDFPIDAKIVGIELGEFFPPEKKFSIDFR